MGHRHRNTRGLPNTSGPPTQARHGVNPQGSSAHPPGRGSRHRGGDPRTRKPRVQGGDAQPKVVHSPWGTARAQSHHEKGSLPFFAPSGTTLRNSKTLPIFGEPIPWQDLLHLAGVALAHILGKEEDILNSEHPHSSWLAGLFAALGGSHGRPRRRHPPMATRRRPRRMQAPFSAGALLPPVRATPQNRPSRTWWPQTATIQSFGTSTGKPQPWG